MAWATMCRPNRVAARSLARPAQAGLVAARRAPSALLDTGRRSACGRCLDSQAWHWASACGWASTASIPSSEALWRSRLCRTSRLTSPITWVGVCRDRSSERVTTPSTEFSTPTTPYWALPAAVAWNTSSKLAQYIRSAAPPKNSMAACSQKVPAGPSTATRCGDSRARQADMISRQMAATCSSLSGPGLAVLIFSITWATRSGRKKGVPSRFLTSPTCSATWARWLSRLSSCWSSESIWTRRSPRVGKGALEGWVMGRLWAVALGWRRSGLCFFEFAQVVDQRLHAGQRHGVVDAGPHATDRLVALELQQPARLGAGQEVVVQRLVAQAERHVHARTAFRGHRVGVELRLVDEAVQQIGLGLVARLHGGHAAQAGFGLALEPLEGQAGDVDAVGGRRVVHRLVVGHQLVVERAGAGLERMAQQVFAHHHQGQAGGADVLLCAAKGHAHAAPVDRARGHVRREIDHQGGIAAQGLQVGQLLKLHAMDGLVAAQVHIAGCLAELPAGRGRQAGVSVGLVAGGNVHFAVLACLFLAFVAPGAGHHKISRFAARQVQRNDGVLGQATTLHEQDLEVRRHRQQLAQIGFGLLVDADELFAAVAHLHDAHAAAVPVEHFGGSLLQHLFGDRGRAGREVVGTRHEQNL